MFNKIVECIEKEDKKNPLTDEQIAALLGMKREQVTALRLKRNIPDSRERRKPHLMRFMEELFALNPNIKESAIKDEINSSGFEVSRFLIRQYMEEIRVKYGMAGRKSVLQGSEKQKLQRAASSAAGAMVGKKSEIDRTEIGEKPKADFQDQTDPFIHIIGYDKSLKSVIMQAKASVLYPPRGLHTMIYGEPGVGKSDLAESMYNFSRVSGMISEHAPFITFNCADYANNHQLLMAQLFGYVKGAFTGADKDKEGLVEKANGGVLFLDEVHRLGPEGQEQLFYLIDKGIFRRLGETSSSRKASLQILMATTENPDSTLLLTFRRRIPMMIEVPSLAARPLKERFKLIANFFSRESTRTNTPVVVDSEVIRAMLLYDCPGNVGQLWSDIQVSCAKGFLERIVNQTDSIRITADDLPQHTRKGLLKIQNRGEVESLTHGCLEISPGPSVDKPLFKEDLYSLSSEIYPYIERRYSQLQEQGMTDETINAYIGGELDSRFKKMIQNLNKNSRSMVKTDLINIVGNEIVDLVEQMLKIAEKRLAVASDTLFYSIAIHLKTTVDRIKQGKPVLNPRTLQLKEEHREEFETAELMVALAEERLSIQFSEGEVGFLAMCILSLSDQEEIEDEGRVGIVLISHGHVASGMSEVANRLLGVTHAKSVEMSLDESPEDALDRVIDAVVSADEGKGVVLLVDMGSLVTFGEIVTQKTGIVTRVIVRTDTVLVIDAVRRAIIPGMEIDQLVSVLEENPKYVTRLSQKSSTNYSTKPKAILTACITGEGSALKVKELLENLLPDLSEKLEIIPIGAIHGNTKEIIAGIRKTKDVIAVVGTINPNIHDLPFIFIESILNGSGTNQLRHLVDFTLSSEVREQALSGTAFLDVGEAAPNAHLEELFSSDLTMFDLEADTKEEAIQKVAALMQEKGVVKIGFAENVWEREQMAPTFIGYGSAIPHADPRFVSKPSIAFARLRTEILWDGNPVRNLFMLALPEDGQGIVTQFYRLLSSPGFEEEIAKAETGQDLIKLIHQKNG
jgi:transcriptional regulator with AAA-type ATPase domain/transcriptional regulatory protein LevR/mannitol/fructose-specific phosphotransferase system IIA component (Ntr-type)